jgi:hypothetical protein
MLDRLLRTNPVRERLHGITDEAVLRQIEKKCAYRSASIRQDLIAISLAVIAIGCSYDVLRPNGWLAWTVYPCITVVVFSVLVAWRRRKYIPVLPGVLHEMGRCRECGYDLASGACDQCPECGAKRVSM